MVIRLIASLAVLICILLLHSPAHAQFALPSNFHVAPMYREFVEAIADHSPTFEAQLRRIGTAPGVEVHMEIVPRVIGARARTRMERDTKGLTAWIEVTRLDNVVELLAHEMEHVIEQIERVDLAGRAKMAETGIYLVSVDGTTFETARAASAGVTVAREVARSKDQDRPC
jgi:hypothetical protein